MNTQLLQPGYFLIRRPQKILDHSVHFLRYCWQYYADLRIHWYPNPHLHMVGTSTILRYTILNFTGWIEWRLLDAVQKIISSFGQIPRKLLVLPVPILQWCVNHKSTLNWGIMDNTTAPAFLAGRRSAGRKRRRRGRNVPPAAPRRLAVTPVGNGLKVPLQAVPPNGLPLPTSPLPQWRRPLSSQWW